MPVAPKPTPELEQAPAPLDSAAVREQLERLLVHPLFANSKRYPALLAYVVDQTLLGNSADLKERSIGIEVFGRSPNYDANADPVVRITAGEVRKRLSQYYYDAAHEGELVLELPIGSYVPIFHAPEPEADPEAIAAAPELAPPVPVLPEEPAPPRPRRMPWIPLVSIVLLTGALGVGIGLRYHPVPPVPPPSNIDRFWEPVTSSANPATFCLG